MLCILKILLRKPGKVRLSADETRPTDACHCRRGRGSIRDSLKPRQKEEESEEEEEEEFIQNRTRAGALLEEEFIQNRTRAAISREVGPARWRMRRR